jgi:hypothetical protein
LVTPIPSAGSTSAICTVSVKLYLNFLHTSMSFTDHVGRFFPYPPSFIIIVSFGIGCRLI